MTTFPELMENRVQLKGRNQRTVFSLRLLNVEMRFIKIFLFLLSRKGNITLLYVVFGSQ